MRRYRKKKRQKRQEAQKCQIWNSRKTQKRPQQHKSLIPSDSEGEKEYRILKNSIVCDFNSGSEKRIVTKVNEDGTFLAEDLGSWLKKQDIFEITVVEDYGDYKKLFYDIVPENADRDEYYYEEEVTEVLPDGSFYTDYTLNYLP